MTAETRYIRRVRVDPGLRAYRPNRSGPLHVTVHLAGGLLLSGGTLALEDRSECYRRSRRCPTYRITGESGAYAIGSAW